MADSSTCLQSMISTLDDIISNLDDSSRKRPRAELTGNENELYRLIYPCLVDRSTNVAAFVMGARGSGKSRLVEECLSKLDSTKFRTLRLNGLVARGNDVGFCVHELVRQLSELAIVGKEDSKLLELMRLKRTSFTSNLSLLDEAFQLARVDEKPILIILDELEAFAGSPASLETKLVERAADRQLLLYHILDRVTAPGSSLCFIGVTSHFGVVSLLEKRVRSRAEGTSRTIFVCPFDSYKSLIDVLIGKVEDKNLRLHLIDWLSVEKQIEDQQVQLVREIMQRNYRIGKDLRWFTRVLSLGLSLYRKDNQVLLSESQKGSLSLVGSFNLEQKCYQTEVEDCSAHTIDKVQFKPCYLLEALKVMGASWCSESNKITSTEPRMKILEDLSSPQVAILLAARRILARDALKEEFPKPLTIHRMLHEYQSYKGQANIFSRHLLLRSFKQMIEMGAFQKSSDHSGGGPLQYNGSSFSEMDMASLSKMPLHVPYELELELTRALKDGLLDCSTALKEWGKRKN
mmetsp:Transcript_21401/g.32502  ORF Transcript_21401/g.32502 Transcript_21401/m.32502 type:complete len:518 (+) Transcript_21401:81-1634(+)